MTNEYPLLSKYLRVQACLAAPNNLCDKAAELERTLKARNLITIDPITQHIETRMPSDLGDAAYYAVQMRGCSSDYPTPEIMNKMQAELARAFVKAGISGSPIACKWRGDEWAEREMSRFNETVGYDAGDHQAPRIHEQKFKRTEGEALLTYRIPTNEIDKLGDVMRDISASVEAAKKGQLAKRS